MLPLVKTKTIKEYFVSSDIIDRFFLGTLEFDTLGNCTKMPKSFGYSPTFEFQLAKMIIASYGIPGKLENFNMQLGLIDFEKEYKSIKINNHTAPTVIGAILTMSEDEVLMF